MRPRLDYLPGLGAAAAPAAAAVAAGLLLLLGMSRTLVTAGASAALALFAGLLVLDRALTARHWARSDVELTRRLPQAFAIGVPSTVRLRLACRGRHRWRLRLFDHASGSLTVDGLPLELELEAGAPVETGYRLTPLQRGHARIEPAELRVRSLLGLGELRRRLGRGEERRVLPDFAQIARFAWLAGDRRLTEIGIKSFVHRGEGTDFRQLAEYQPGDSVRHIDWKASARAGRPIVREFQEERDQCVVLLLDCGRRMRADEAAAAAGSHFDHVLNGVLLLAYVALRHGDRVGALSFAGGAAAPRYVAPRKGTSALNGMMAALGDLEPTLAHPDYLAAARDLMARQRKRALVIIVTNFRDEDGDELQAALRLLRTRHLVMLASLRERVVAEILAQPLATPAAAVEVAGAQLYLAGRRAALARVASERALSVDAEPERLGIALVNAYHAVKTAQLL